MTPSVFDFDELNKQLERIRKESEEAGKTTDTQQQVPDPPEALYEYGCGLVEVTEYEYKAKYPITGYYTDLILDEDDNVIGEVIKEPIIKSETIISGNPVWRVLS